MLIAEEVLLLLTADDSGRPVMNSMLDYVLAGALLTDLTLAGNVRITEKGETGVRKNRVVVVLDAAWPTDELLVGALTLLGSKEKWFTQSVITRLRPKLRQKLYDRLVRAEIVQRDESRWLGLIPVTHYPALDVRPEQVLLTRLDEVLLFDAEPDVRIASIIALLQAGNLLFGVVDRGRRVNRKEIRAKAKELMNQYWTAKVTYDTIQAASAAAAAGGA